MLPIRIMTRDFKLINEVDQYSSLQITRSWHGIGRLDLVVNRYLRGADVLLRGRIIFPHNHLNKAYVIRHREIKLDEKGKETENWNIIAISLKDWIASRLTIPPTHTAYDNKSSNAESVILHYTNNNVINPIDHGNKIDDIVLADNLNRGQNISWQSRFKNLADEIEEIAFLSGLGWNIEIDIENKQYVFKVLEGKNRTVNQSDLPPAIFSPEFNTLKELKYTESELEYKNYAVVVGAGEGTERRIVTVGNATGFERRTLFVDARDIEEVDEADNPLPTNEIEQKLINRGQ